MQGLEAARRTIRDQRTLLALALLVCASAAILSYAFARRSEQQRQIESADRAAFAREVAHVRARLNLDLDLLQHDVGAIRDAPGVAKVLQAFRYQGEAAAAGPITAWRTRAAKRLAEQLRNRVRYRSLTEIGAFERGLESLRVDGDEGRGGRLDRMSARALWYAEHVRGAARSRDRSSFLSELRIESGEATEGPAALLEAATRIHLTSSRLPAVLVLALDLRPILAGFDRPEWRHDWVGLVDAAGHVVAGQGKGTQHDDTAWAKRLAALLQPWREGSKAAARTSSSDGGRLCFEPLITQDAEGLRLGLARWRPPGAIVQPGQGMGPLASAVVACLLLWGFGLGAVFTLRRRRTTAPPSVAAAREPRSSPSPAAVPVPRSSIEPAAEARPEPVAELRDLRLEPAEVDLRALLREVAECLERDQTDFELRCHKALPRKIRTDRSWFGPLVLWAGRRVVEVAEGEPIVLSLWGESAGTKDEQLALTVEVASRRGLPGTEGDGDVLFADGPIASAGARRLLDALGGRLDLRADGAGGTALRVRFPVEVAPASESATSPDGDY